MLRWIFRSARERIFLLSLILVVVAVRLVRGRLVSAKSKEEAIALGDQTNAIETETDPVEETLHCAHCPPSTNGVLVHDLTQRLSESIKSGSSNDIRTPGPTRDKRYVTELRPGKLPPSSWDVGSDSDSDTESVPSF